VVKKRPKRSGAYLHNSEPQCAVMEWPLVAQSRPRQNAHVCNVASAERGLVLA
jgi:hypothetical protein